MCLYVRQDGDRLSVERLAWILAKVRWHGYWARYTPSSWRSYTPSRIPWHTRLHTHVQYDAKHGIRAAMVSALEKEFGDFNLKYSIGGQVCHVL